MSDSLNPAFKSHKRQWQNLVAVYAVVSRRSRGLSIGINLNLDDACNFNCIYCCVDRKVRKKAPSFDAEQLKQELSAIVQAISTEDFWEHPPFCHAPRDYRTLKDISFSGNGEPTASPLFHSAIQSLVELRKTHSLHELPTIVHTNGTRLNRPEVLSSFDLLYEKAKGEAWVKLDAGSNELYSLVDRCATPFESLKTNIVDFSKLHKIVIQSLFVKYKAVDVSLNDFKNYVQTLAELLNRGALIREVQLYSVARDTAEKEVEAVDSKKLQDCAAFLREKFSGLSVVAY